MLFNFPFFVYFFHIISAHLSWGILNLNDSHLISKSCYYFEYGILLHHWTSNNL